MLARFLRLLLEAVQDINRRREFRNVDHTEGAVGVPDPYLLYPWTNGRHGLPIVRIIAHLHPICNDLQSKWPRPAVIAFFDRD
ncbi:hypothetical protein ALQ69_03942 [Pseudomonas savastanoi pv. glycinea]|nr:hypothetical protein ALQ69_03942 [Pseudomonas savastanoi pv. glycinea]